MMDYPAPVDKLLSFGEAHQGDWPNYPRRFGFGPEHVPDLIRMATDPELNLGDPDSDGVWAPLHAWRTLGQLRAEQAVEPLLRILTDAETDDDYAREELPIVLGMIGPASLPGVESHLQDADQDVRLDMIWALRELGTRHPELRARCVELLAGQLEDRRNEPDVNGWALAALLDLKAVEAVPVIERAFAASRIEESIAGDWPLAQYELGLISTPPPPRRFINPNMPPGLLQLRGGAPRPSRTAREKAKKRYKEVKKAKKRNRKKK